MQIKDEAEAVAILGGNLSEPSKMPCYTFDVPAKRCKTGRKLRKIKGSICSICYALKGRFMYPHVQVAADKRYKNLNKKGWAAALTYLINRKEQSGYFRLFSQGDIKDLTHLKNIVRVCENLPHIKFWLPTKEYGIVQEFINGGGKIPSNLVVRLSAYMIDGPPPMALAKRLGVNTSGVSTAGYTCPAPSNGNFCGACRKCWDGSIENISYKKH